MAVAVTPIPEHQDKGKGHAQWGHSPGVSLEPQQQVAASQFPLRAEPAGNKTSRAEVICVTRAAIQTEAPITFWVSVDCLVGVI